MNRQRQRWLEEAVLSDRGENAAHALLVTIASQECNFVLVSLQTTYKFPNIPSVKNEKENILRKPPLY